MLLLSLKGFSNCNVQLSEFLSKNEIMIVRALHFGCLFEARFAVSVMLLSMSYAECLC